MDFSALNDTVLSVFGEGPPLPVTIGGLTVKAIYDSRHFAIEDGEAGASDLITTIAVRTIDVPPLTDDTIILVRGQSFRRFEVRTDGQGMTTIQLERIA